MKTLDRIILALLTGGTLKDEQQFAQDSASNEYGNVYNRALTTYNTNYQGFLNDYQQQLQKFQQDYGVYQGGFSNALVRPDIVWA